jgi:5-oxoprolinase (ATP-hydrolysing) subunit C
MTLRVLEPGLSSLVVDYGRPHERSLGVPVGGAADRTSLALGNALVGNRPDAAALEVTLAGPTLQAEHELACVVYGAPFDLTSDRQQLAMGKTFTLHPQELLHLRGATDGARAYLCVSGGFQEPEVLGSRSALQPVRHGDVLSCLKSAIHTRWARIDFAWRRARAIHAGSDRLPHRTLLIVDGPQATWFLGDGLTPRAGAPPSLFTVGPASNRMGLRLQGHALPVPDRELVSEPVCPGTIQVTRDGQCIILGVDSQTIGGYPKIGQVISADMDELGQLRPADQVRFVRVGLAEAEALYRQKQAELRHWILRMRTSLDGL